MRRRSELAILLGLVALGGWLRLRRLELVEFKADEATALQLAHDVVGGDFPLVGLTSSVGARNPPLFPYLLALPAALDDDPLFATAAIAIAAVAAVALTFVVLRPRFGLVAAFVATTLFATAPWAVLFGRKIWAQDLLPLVTVPLLWTLFVVLERTHTRWVAALPVLLCLAVQLHFSALVLVAPAAIVVAYRARETNWAAVAAGAVVALLLLAPYGAHEARHGFEDLRLLVAEGRGSGEKAFPGEGAVEAVRTTVRATSSVGWDFVTGASGVDFRAFAGGVRTASWMASAFIGVVLLLAVASFLVGAARRALVSRRYPFVVFELRAARRLLLSVWLVAVWASFATSTPNDIYPHYLIVTYPASFAAIGVAAADICSALRHRLPQGGVVVTSVAVVVATVFVAFTIEFQHYLEVRGGTGGDYGVAYVHTADLATAARSRGVGFDAHLVALDYLARPTRDERGSPPPNGIAAVRDTLRPSEPLACRGQLLRFGPLEACLPGGA